MAIFNSKLLVYQRVPLEDGDFPVRKLWRMTISGPIFDLGLENVSYEVGSSKYGGSIIL